MFVDVIIPDRSLSPPVDLSVDSDISLFKLGGEHFKSGVEHFKSGVEHFKLGETLGYIPNITSPWVTYPIW